LAQRVLASRYTWLEATTIARYRHGRPTIGYSYLHTAIDDHSRLAYSEILPDECKETATAFWQRAHTWFTAAGITIERVMTDNGSCYKSALWQDALAVAGISLLEPPAHRLPARYGSGTPLLRMRKAV
jgi:hypothetical protein